MSSLSVQTHIPTIRGLGALKRTQREMGVSLRRLSTGTRINSAADDPAGLIASEQLSSEIVEVEQSRASSVRAGFSAVMAEVGYAVVGQLLLEAKSHVQALANEGGLSDEERDSHQIDLDAILSAIDRIALTAGVEGQKLLDGSGQLKADGAQLSLRSATAATNGLVSDGDGNQFSLADLGASGRLNARSGQFELAANVVEQAIRDFAKARAEVGGFVRFALDSNINVADVTLENLHAARSAIRDTDYAQEMANFVRQRTLEQTQIASLAVANVERTRALSLLS